MKYGKYEKRPLTEDEFNELEESRYFLSKVKDPFLKFTHNTYNYIKLSGFRPQKSLKFFINNWEPDYGISKFLFIIEMSIQFAKIL